MRAIDRPKALLRGTFLYRPLKAASAWSRRIAARRRQSAWMRRMQRFYAQFVRPGDLAFDVGANVGSRTAVFLRLGARVVAVEPQKECARALFASFCHHPGFHLVNKAAGAEIGRAEMLIGRPDRASTLSRSFADALAGSGQIWRKDMWRETRVVPVTTLDALIAEFGTPSFIKIDAEGYEPEILRGLSQPVAAMSFEFIPACLDPALRTIRDLSRFGPVRLNYAIGERFEWALDRWVTPDELVPILERYRPKTDFPFGDVYARFGDG